MSDVPPARVVSAPVEDPEAVWLRETYQPNAVNLTVRAVVGGMLIGCLLCVSNLYVFFKTGWSIGVTLTACILAFIVFKGVQGLGGRRFDVHENNALTTVASGAGYMTGGGNMAAFGALVMVTTIRPDTVGMMVWFALIAALGVFAAIPIKRQLVNKEALPFPTGRATAETLTSMHEVGSKSGTEKMLALLAGAGIGGLLAFLRDYLKWIPEKLEPGIMLAGHKIHEWTVTAKVEVVLLAGGALMSFRTGWSLLLGGTLTYVFLAPSLVENKLVATVSYKAIVGWSVWPGAAILVGAGLTAFALDFRSLGRALSGITRIFGGKARVDTRAVGIAAVETPEWWFPAAFIGLGPIVVVLMTFLFDIPIWAACIAIPLSVIMGFVAARVTGETDVTPTKALGPVTQIIYGVLTPGNLTGNIMAANVTGGVGLHAADLLTTLKTGWLLGAKPRHQLYAQLFGVCAGAIILVPMFNLIIPDPKVLGTEAWPAPSCVVWAGVSKAFSNGIGTLSTEARNAMFIGLALGIALALAEKFAPKQLKPFIPSPYGVGIAMVIPFSNAFAMFMGATVAALLKLYAPAINDRFTVPVASGLIAGESLVGVGIAVALTISGMT